MLLIHFFVLTLPVILCYESSFVYYTKDDNPVPNIQEFKKLAVSYSANRNENIVQNRTSKILTERGSLPLQNRQNSAGRQFLLSYNSPNPVMVLVDSTPQSRANAANFIKILHDFHQKVGKINFQLMMFNATGVTTILASTFNNHTRFLKILEDDSQQKESSYLGPPRPEGTAAFFAALNAAKLLTSDCGLLIFTDRMPIDEDIAYHASQFILNKRIKVYVVWGGNKMAVNEDYKFLKELCELTEGKFIFNSNANLSDFYRRRFYEEDVVQEDLNLVLAKQDLQGVHTLQFPYDYRATGIHISLKPDVQVGKLTTPSGIQINLLDSDDVSNFGQGSFTERTPENYNIHINTTKLLVKENGIWTMYIENANIFNVSIYVYSKLMLVEQNNGTDHKLENVLKFDANEDIYSIKDVVFYDHKGNVILDNKNVVWQSENGTQTNLVKLPIKHVPANSFYAAINGNDMHGYNFSRLQYINPSKSAYPKPSITVEVSENSDLIIESAYSNPYPKIYFEVTNHGQRPVDLRFAARDDKYLLLNMMPLRAIIDPHSSRTITLYLILRPNSYNDLITFLATSGETTEKRVLLDIGSKIKEQDQTSPEINYKFTSDCTDIVIGSCSSGSWVIEVSAKDSEAGLLKVTSHPKGLYFPHGYTTGTQNEITGYFVGSCCSPDIQITAVDRANNRSIKNANAYLTTWSVGAIVALCLGILILIILIIVIIWAFRNWKARRESFDLPTYRSRY